MSVPFRKQVKITKLPDLPAIRRVSAGIDAELRQRDTRPGRFTVKGSFISLPDPNDAKSKGPRT